MMTESDREDLPQTTLQTAFDFEAGRPLLRNALTGPHSGMQGAEKRVPQSHELPRALMPWGALLDLFPLEIARALGPMLQRLDLVIGPLRVQARQGTGEPDGFYGIARRGSYERLLLSEWLLAEEMPDEFARRAAMGEHGFLEPARREPVGARTSIALFDAGPNQLGAPRIAHLAALIILARRAEAAGASFQWGVLQQSPETLHTDVTAATILNFLRSRSPREATQSDVEAWREKAGSQEGAEDLWIVGGPRLARLPAVQGAARLQVREAEEPEARTLTAEVIERGRAKPPVLLELPDAATCIRLLRDPLRARTAEPARSSIKYSAPTSNLLFVSPTRLLARSGSDHVIVYPIPRHPQEGAGNPRVYHPKTPAPILAAGRIAKSIILVTTTKEPDVLLLECVGPRSDRYAPVRFRLPSNVFFSPANFNEQLLPCFYVSTENNNMRWFVQLEDYLLHLQFNSASQKYQTLAEMTSTKAVCSTRTSCSFIGKVSSEWAAMSIPKGEERRMLPRQSGPAGNVSHEWALMSIAQDGGGQVHFRYQNLLNAFFGYGGSISHPDYGLAAVEETAGEWKLLYYHANLTKREQEMTLYMPQKDRVVGVVALSEGEGIGETTVEPGLIILQSDRRKIVVMGRNWTRSVPPASSPIVQLTANPHGPEIAYLTERGELIVYSLWLEQVLYRLETRAE